MSNKPPSDRCWCGVPTDHLHAGHDLMTAEGKVLLDAWGREADDEWDDWELARRIRTIEISALGQSLCEEHQRLAAACGACVLTTDTASEASVPPPARNLISIWKENPEAINDALRLNPDLARRLRQMLLDPNSI